MKRWSTIVHRIFQYSTRAGERSSPSLEGTAVLEPLISPVVHLQEKAVLHAQLVVPDGFRLEKHSMDLRRDSLPFVRRRFVHGNLGILQPP